VKKKKSMDKVFGSLTKPVEKIKTVLTGIKKKKALVSTASPNNTDKSERTATITPAAPVKKPRLRLRPNIQTKFKIKPVYLIPIVILALAVSIVFSLRKKEEKPLVVEPAEEMVVTPSEPEEDVAGVENGTDEPAETTEGVFYDLKITDIEANPSEIVVFENTLVVTDKQTGKIYTSSRQTPKFEALQNTYPGINSARDGDRELAFSDNEGYKYYDLINEALSTAYAQQNLGITATYLDFIYSIEDDSIIKYTVSGDTITGTTWGQSEDFRNAKSIAISYSIYVLTQEGEVVEYTSGEKIDFELTGLEASLNSPVQIVTTPDLENIYIADAGNNRVVSIDDAGAFVNAYTAKEGSSWSDLKSISVSPDETMLYVLSGSRVYEVEL
jgi:hypothetical protein